MKLVPRLVLLGGFLPLVGVLLAVAIAGHLFRRSLLDDVDQRLMAQAAVESVSMFDGPQGRPHLHMLSSSLADEVAAFAPDTTVFNSDGHVVLSTLETPPNLPEGVGWVEAAGEPERMRLASLDGGTRALTIRLVRHEGDYTMLLTTSLQPIDATMRTFYRAVLGTVAAVWLVLMAVLYQQGRAIVGRVHALRRWAPAIRQGKLTREVRREGNDELTELGDVLQDAAATLAEYNEAQERFLANAAHQLKTPISVLRTEVELALRKPRDAEQLRDALRMARGQALHLGNLATRLLDFESLRSSPLHRQEHRIAERIDAVLARMGARAVESRIVLRRIGERDPVAPIDAMLFEQALENLVDNALRFAPPNTVVEVHVQEREDVVAVMVRDDGPGIQPTEVPHLFEPFAPGHGQKAQTGLGLAFVADVARKHGGRPLLAPLGERTGVGFEVPAG